jgi:hypothetical protein
MFLADRSFDRGIAAEDRAMRLLDRTTRMTAAEAKRLADIDEKRQETLFIDSKIALDALKSGGAGLGAVLQKFTDRRELLPTWGVTNLDLTEDIIRLAASAYENPDDLLNLKNRLEGYVNTGIAYEVLDKPERTKYEFQGGRWVNPYDSTLLTASPVPEPDIATLSPGDIRYVDGVETARGREIVEKPDEFNQAQWNAAQFGRRTKVAGDIIEALGPNFTGIASRGVGVVPAGLRTEERQSFDQAVRNFINATLRSESGAAIAPTEFVSADLQYIPQVGDTEAQLEQKTENRRIISAAFRLEAGGAYELLLNDLTQESGAPAEALIEQSVNIWTPIPAGNSKEGEKAVDANGLEIIVQDGMWVEKI